MKEMSPVKADQLVNEYQQRRGQAAMSTARIMFSGVGDNDVYNITAPIRYKDQWVIAGRVEARDSEYSTVMFFIEENGCWQPLDNAPTFSLQDPFFTYIGDELVFGGVEVSPHPTVAGQLTWRTVFYRGVDIFNLNFFAAGPAGMKDIRLCQLSDDKIAVFTRPQGTPGGRGTIGYTEIGHLDALTHDVIENAQLLDQQFIADEWGGVNETHLLENGTIGLLAHIASFDTQGKRHYYPTVFIFDPATRHYSKMKIIATRQDLAPGAAKRPDLVDVIFPGGLIAINNQYWKLYVGASDAEAHWIKIENPFSN